MRKIPTLFRRDPDNPRTLLRDVHPAAQWVLEGEGVPTRKYDGTCVMFDGAQWWSRREVKPGKTAPYGFVPSQTDETTGKTVGWEPIEQSSFVKFWREAMKENHRDDAGTYELVGPRINGNPESSEKHALIYHGDAAELPEPPGGRTFESLRHQVLALLARCGVEGIVWHHPDGRMAKLKGRDFV